MLVKYTLYYEKDLKEAGFGEEHGLSKLRLLKKALEKNEKEDVYRNFLTLSYNELLSYIQDENNTMAVSKNNQDIKNPKTENTVFTMNGKTAITINKDIDQKNYAYLVRICQYAIKAIRRGEKIFYMSVKNMEEFELFESAFKKLLRQLRRDTRSK